MTDAEIYSRIIDATDHNNLEKIYADSLDVISGINGIDVVMVYIVDEISQNAVLEAYRNLTDDYIEKAKQISRGRGITWRIIDKPKVQVFSDVQNTAELGEAGRILGIRSAVGVPVTIEDECIGVIWFFSFSPDHFSDKTVKFLSSIGRILGRNISRIKQKEEIFEKNKRLSIISQLSIYFNETSGLEDILRMIDHLMSQIGIVDKKAIYLVDDKEEKKVARLVAHNGIPKQITNTYSEIEYPDGITWECIEKGEILYYPFEKIRDINFSDEAFKTGIRSIVAIPIKMNNDTIGSCNFLSFKRDRYTEDELEYIKALGSQIGSAVARIKMYESVKAASVTDALSGLYNSRYFHESLEKYIAGTERNRSNVSVIVFDMDDFKNINDKYGHIVGDELIKRVGETLIKSVRKMDIAARYGGDEFAVILPGTGYELSRNIASRILDKLKEITVDTDKGPVKPQMSVGISTYAEGINSCSELIKMADFAMYEAKRNDNNKLIHFNDLKRTG